MQNRFFPAPDPASSPTLAGGRGARALRSLVLTTLLAVLAMLLTPATALAHDSLVSSDPADGAVLDAAPARITLTFSDQPLDVSPMVRVIGPDGAVVLEQAPRIEGTAAVVDLPPLENGTVTVQWRVVSGDGHPIEGSFTFEVQAPAGTSPSASPEGTSAAASEESPATSSPAAETTRSAAAEDGSSGGLGWVGLAAFVVPLLAILAVGAVLLLRRRR